MQKEATYKVLDYAPFGFLMPSRSFTGTSGYKFGFNGMLKDGKDWTGNNDSHLDFGARIYDSRLGRWLAVDPLASKYPWSSPYSFVANKPINFIDPDGKKIVWPQGEIYDTFKTSVLELAKKSTLFNSVYQALDAHPLDFTIKFHRFHSNNKGDANYNQKDNTLNFEYVNSVFSGIKIQAEELEIAEEFFHAFQYLFYGINTSIRETMVDYFKNEKISEDELRQYGTSSEFLEGRLQYINNITFIEAEAKIFDYLVLKEAGIQIEDDFGLSFWADNNEPSGIFNKFSNFSSTSEFIEVEINEFDKYQKHFNQMNFDHGYHGYSGKAVYGFGAKALNNRLRSSRGKKQIIENENLDLMGGTRIYLIQDFKL